MQGSERTTKEYRLAHIARVLYMITFCADTDSGDRNRTVKHRRQVFLPLYNHLAFPVKQTEPALNDAGTTTFQRFLL